MKLILLFIFVIMYRMLVPKKVKPQMKRRVYVEDEGDEIFMSDQYNQSIKFHPKEDIKSPRDGGASWENL